MRFYQKVYGEVVIVGILDKNSPAILFVLEMRYLSRDVWNNSEMFLWSTITFVSNFRVEIARLFRERKETSAQKKCKKYKRDYFCVSRKRILCTKFRCSNKTKRMPQQSVFWWKNYNLITCMNILNLLQLWSYIKYN